MENRVSATGYGPSTGLGRFARLVFDGDERKYGQWEVKFLRLHEATKTERHHAATT